MYSLVIKGDVSLSISSIKGLTEYSALCECENANNKPSTCVYVSFDTEMRRKNVVDKWIGPDNWFLFVFRFHVYAQNTGLNFLDRKSARPAVLTGNLTRIVMKVIQTKIVWFLICFFFYSSKHIFLLFRNRILIHGDFNTLVWLYINWKWATRKRFRLLQFERDDLKVRSKKFGNF